MVTAYEGISDEDLNTTLRVIPLPKPKTVIEFELTISGWTVEQVSEVTKKICEEHKGNDLRIKFVGSIVSREYS